MKKVEPVPREGASSTSRGTGCLADDRNVLLAALNCARLDGSTHLMCLPEDPGERTRNVVVAVAEVRDPDGPCERRGENDERAQPDDFGFAVGQSTRDVPAAYLVEPADNGRNFGRDGAAAVGGAGNDGQIHEVQLSLRLDKSLYTL